MGFIAKVAVLEALIQVHLTWLAAIAILFSVIGAYYYIKVIKVMYFEKPAEEDPLVCTMDSKLAITLNGGAVLLLGIFPGVIFQICSFKIYDSMGFIVWQSLPQW